VPSLPIRSASASQTGREDYQFTFQQLAGNTHALLAVLGILRAIFLGHSTGGMLAIRYELMSQDAVRRQVSQWYRRSMVGMISHFAAAKLGDCS
jgi:pimeloyl-ACP methyl ester carboxylesterase